jgi:hypothetical protein
VSLSAPRVLVWVVLVAGLAGSVASRASPVVVCVAVAARARVMAVVGLVVLVRARWVRNLVAGLVPVRCPRRVWSVRRARARARGLGCRVRSR